MTRFQPHSDVSAGASAPSLAVRVLAALSLCAGGAALIASTASAGPPHREFVGTQAYHKPTLVQWNRVRDAKLRTFRLQLDWARVERDRPTGCDEHTCERHVYDWSGSDQRFAGAAQRGIRILPYLLGSPRWATSDSRWPPVRYRPGYANWKRQAFYDFAKAAARRYGVGGDFWRLYPRLPEIPARDWQVWNEPNLPNFWWWDERGRKVAREYAALLKPTAAHLRAGDPAARVVTAGMTSSLYSSLSPGGFLREVFSVRGTASSVDFIGLHPYAPDPAGMIEQVRLARRGVSSTAARALPMWLTEVGWSTGGPLRRSRAPGSSLAEREHNQARYLREAYRRLFESSDRLRVRGATWFSLADLHLASPHRDMWYHHAGLFREDGVTPKLAWRAMRCVTGTGSCRY
jgi:polysaccharide biosynthesis protein PslG